MARRKAKALIPPPLLAKLAGVAILLWIASQALQSANTTLLVIGLGAVICGVLFIPRYLRQQQRQRVMTMTNWAIDQHLDQLARRRSQLVREDAYGKVEMGPWEKEIDYFVTHHVRPRLTTKDQVLLDDERSVVVNMVAARTEMRMRERPVFSAFSNDLSPTEFEIFCAEQLRLAGWSAGVTRKSRDQGVDVIGEKSGIRIVLQCKLYSVPVGNQAVQEIVAGRAHERAHWGAVVTNSRYTSAAEQLAFTNGILLLHYSDLVNVDAILHSKVQAAIR